METEIKHSAFSLIEIMVVIAIVAILAAISIPSYRNYLTRTSIANSLNLATQVQVQLMDYYATNNSFPSTNAFELTNPSSDVAYIGWVPIWNGIEIWYNNSEVGGGLMLFPEYNQSTNNYEWTCTSHHQSRIRCDLLPASCQGPNPNGPACIE